MSEDAFRWVIAAGVLVAVLAFVIQAVAAIAIYRILRTWAQKVTPLVDRAAPIVEASRKMLEENRPRIAEISTDAVAIVKTARQHVQRIGLVVNDVADRTQHRVAQIDKKVEETVDQIGEVSDTLKGAMLKPVREVNALVNGVRAAIAAYAQGARRQVDRATQDEEMFI